MGNKHVSAVTELGDGHKIACRVIGQLGIQRRIDRMPCSHHQQGVTVGCGLGDNLRTDQRVATAAVVDNNLLAELLNQRR